MWFFFSSRRRHTRSLCDWSSDVCSSDLSSHLIADGPSAVSTSTRRRSAVSWEDFQTSSACCSGESSSPNAAWMPPCALAELQDWSAPLVANATRAPARWAETAAARPEAPLPITSTSKEESDTKSGPYH